MSSSSVWVQLYYYDGKGEEGNPIKIRPIPEDVADLIKATKTDLKIDYAPLNKIVVYPPESKPPFSEHTPIRGDKILKDLIDELGNKNPPVFIGYDHPLIVVAPAPASHLPVQANNEQQQRLPIMSSSSVWVQLYYKGKDEPEGRPVKIEPIPKNIDIGALAEAAKAKLKPEIDYAPVSEIDVFPPKSSGDENKYKSGKKLEKVIDELKNTTPPTSYDHPLIVVAPAPAPHLPVQAKEVEELLEFVRNKKDGRTKNKDMSKASKDWAESILAAYHVKHHRMEGVVDSVGSFEDPQPYKWTVQTTEGATWNKGALVWLKENFLRSSCPYDLKEVTGAKLPTVRGNRRSATGKCDILIGAANHIHKGSTFDFAMGLVELKTNRYPLKVGQNLLQLLSLSTVSAFKKAVVLLATDCNTKWELFYFSDVNTITSQVYDHGSKAWDDFLQLLNSASERDYVGKSLWISSLPEVAEQDLAGFDMSERDKKKAKAEEDEIMLQHVADQLGDIYGERPTIPWWAHANARVPDYYD